jgi:hypothetical protein
LRSELILIRNEREIDLRSNLLTYVQALPERELTSLTSDVSDDVRELNKVFDYLLFNVGCHVCLPRHLLIYLVCTDLSYINIYI